MRANLPGACADTPVIYMEGNGAAERPGIIGAVRLSLVRKGVAVCGSVLAQCTEVPEHWNREGQNEILSTLSRRGHSSAVCVP